MPDEKPDHHRTFKRPHLPTLHIGVRIVLLGVGWVMLAVGFAGLLLPGLQGILTILLGAAILSVASEKVHRALKALLQRWPKVSERLDHFRHSLHDKLTRHKKAD
ncbi:MAG: PGPGW domain-containing protein [Thermoanaerobaculia bacterium]